MGGKYTFKIKKNSAVIPPAVPIVFDFSLLNVMALNKNSTAYNTENDIGLSQYVDKEVYIVVLWDYTS